MHSFEDELRSALRRREPSPDFTARVLARVAAVPAGRTRRPWVRWVAAMAASVMLAAGAVEYRRYQGEKAKFQVLLAVRIAAVKLNKAHRKIQMLNAVHRSNS
jgi:hypothetical protein